MAISFKDFNKQINEEQLDETPVTKAKQPYRPGSIDPATGKTREAPKGTYAYDKAQREKNKVNEEETIEEAEMTSAEKDKREKIVKGMKKSYKDFVAKYGSRAKEVMYATATKRAMGEETEIEEDLEEAKKDDYWDFKDLKDEPKSTTRKVSGTRYGGSAQKDEPEDDDDDDNKKSAPAVKRGRGRPAGSKSGARQKGNGNKNYGGLAFHSLNLPNSNK